MSRSTLMCVLIALVTVVRAQSSEDNLFFKDQIQSQILSEENIFKTDGYFNWGASIIKGTDGQYHLFYSRWKKELNFTGWLTHSEIAHATSPNPYGPWAYQETVLRSRGMGHWDAITAHNPKIKFFEGKYYLYYVSTNLGDRAYTDEELQETARTGYSHPNWKILRPNQRCGVAVATSLHGPWKRMDEPLLEPSGPIATITVNPAITRGEDGTYHLVIKGDTPGSTTFQRNQAIALSDSPIGPFQLQQRAVIDDIDTEDMSLWYDAQRKRYYGVFHAHDFIGMISSADGSNWQKASEYVLLRKKLQMKSGREIIPDRMERPFIYEENGIPLVLSLAIKKGNDSYTIFLPISQSPFPVPNSRQIAWQEAELGAVFHYDLHVFDQKPYNQEDNRINPIADYQMLNPPNLDTDQWIRAVKDAGFTFAIITATHETGFALFQSEANPFSMRALNYQAGKGDIVRDFVNSCRKYGIKPGIFLGIRWNSFLGVHDFKVKGQGELRDGRQQWYNQLVEGMVTELCTNYGELFEIWFDGGADHPQNGAPDVLPIVQKYQPNCLFYHNGQLAEARWGGSESGTVDYPNWSTFPYHCTGAGESSPKRISENNFQLLKSGDPDGPYWMPAMSDAPLRGYNGGHKWFWEPDSERHIFPLKSLMDMYYKSVGRNSTLIIGLTPDAEGLLPTADVKRLQEWGEELQRRFDHPIAQCSGTGNLYYLEFESPQLINHLMIQENIRLGERIRKYKVEGRHNGKWIQLCEGQSVGHKRIERFEDIEVEGVKLTVESSIAEPQLKTMQAFYIIEKNTISSQKENTNE